MAEHNRNPDPDTDASPSQAGRAGQSVARPRRGLSHRLRAPLTVEAATDGGATREDPPSPAPQKISPAQVDAAPAPEAPSGPVGDPLGTRRVAPKTPEPSPEGLLSVGVLLQSRYKILAVVGIGGMGAVYKAQDLRFPGVMRLCAVKEMMNTATDPEVRKMIVRSFEREASILATLSHPATPQVYDYFTEGERSYLVLEFIDGKDLGARVAETEGFFPEALVVDWATQLCDVLTFLHNHRPRPIIFRDLNPSNIMLDPHGRIRLVDFGIAKLFQSGEKGTTIGTEGYTPPEQYRGVAEPRGDVYALGATMHHLLSKQDPRLEPPFSFKERPIHQTNPTVSREVVSVIEKSLEYEINERWGSAEEFRRALLSVPSAKGLVGSMGDTTSFLGPGVIKPLWRFACEDEVRGSVTVANDIVVAPSYDHNVYALDVDSGTFLWKYATEGGIGSSPTVADGMVVFGSTDRVIYSVDLMAGFLMWTAGTKGRVFSTAFPHLDHFFIGSDDGKLYAIHSRSGRKAWEYAADGGIRSRPYVDDHLVLFSCHEGLVYALSLSRELKWRFRARRGILASPILSEGLVLIGSLDWNFYALDSRSGWTAWKYRTGGAIASTAAVCDDLVIFGSADGYIYALEASDGRMVWRYRTEGQVTGSVTPYEGAVYVGGVDGAIYCLDARAGTLRWSYQTDGAITGAPFAVDGVVYFGSGDHYVYALPA